MLAITLLAESCDDLDEERLDVEHVDEADEEDEDELEDGKKLSNLFVVSIRFCCCCCCCC